MALQFKLYEWTKCIPSITASFPNPNTINVEWARNHESDQDLIQGYFVSRLCFIYKIKKNFLRIFFSN